jgi:hypothetical protein
MKKLMLLFMLIANLAHGQNQNLNIMYVSPKQFGATFDGVTDDIAALEATYNYCKSLAGYKMVVIQLPPGVCRITRPWILGTRFVEESNCFSALFVGGTAASTINLTDYTSSRWVNVISVEGSGATALYLDFDAANSAVLRAGIYYAIQGDARASTSIDLYTAHISGIGFYGKGYFNNGTPAEPRATTYSETNNQIGILGVYNFHLSIFNCSFNGLKEGIVLNNSYMGWLKNSDFRNCRRAYYTLQSHAAIVENVTVTNAWRAFEIRSGQTAITNIFAGNCTNALYLGLGSSANVFNSCLFKTNNATVTDAQVVIGDNPSDPVYVTNSLCEGIVFNGLTIVANKADGGPGLAIWMKESARRISVNGGTVLNSLKKYTNANNELILQGVQGDFTDISNPNIPVNYSYRRDADAEFKSVTFPAWKSSAETLRFLYIDANGKVILVP